MPDPRRLYGRLLGLYPAHFREEYRELMERQFRDDYRDARTTGQRLRVLASAAADLAVNVPSQLGRECLQDLRHASRVYRKRAGSTVLAIVALGFAIGASTGVFSVLHALLLRTLPFSEPDRLVEVLETGMNAMRGRAAFYEWNSSAEWLQSAATFSVSEMNVGELRLKVSEASANFFDVLGTRIAFGRGFRAEEDAPGAGHVAVISHSLWQQRFAGDPAAIGATLRINGLPFTVVGVAPPRFDYPAGAKVWTTSVFEFERIPKHGPVFFQTIARLKHDVTLAQANDRLEKGRLSLLREQLAGSIRNSTWVLALLVFFVLLTAFANVAQLQLSRTTERRHEMAIRSALGASRARLVQQLIVEAVAVSLAGAAAGALIAHWISRLATAFAPAQIAAQEYTVLDPSVVAFSAGLAILMGALFGALPVFALGRWNKPGLLLRTHRGSHDRAARSMRSSLIAFQAALALVLGACSFTMGRTFLRMLDTDLGYRTENTVTLNVSLQGTDRKPGAFFPEALDRLRAVPGVESAAGVSFLPLGAQTYMANAFRLDSGQEVPSVIINAVTPGYFETVRTRVLAGREFLPSPEPAVIVNRAFAEKTGLPLNVILGRAVKPHWADHVYHVVGVVETARIGGPAFAGSPQIFFRVDDEPLPALTLVARVRGSAAEYVGNCRDAVRSIDRSVAVYDAQTWEQRLAAALGRPQFFTSATVLLAALALLLAAAGVYGAAAYSVAQRTQEIGVRMALGATSDRVRSMMLGNVARPIIGGAAIGVAGSLAAGRYLESLVAGAPPVQAGAAAVAAAVLLSVGLLAGWNATAGVLRIDPADAVRAE